MGLKCCTTLVHGSIPVVKEATQALASEYALEAGPPTLLPSACWCADLNRDPDTKSFMQVQPVSGYATPNDGPSDPKAFSAEHRQYSKNSLQSCSTVDLGDLGGQLSTVAAPAPDQQLPGQAETTPCADAPKAVSRQGSGVDYESMSESEKHREAKRIIREFVTGMVKGQEVIVVTPTGSFIDCLLGLTRGLDTLKVKPKWPKDAHARRIPLSSVDEILVGTDTGYSQMETPLDDFCVTLVLNSADCVTVRMSDVDSRDTLAACLTMFCNDARSQGMSAVANV